MCVAVVNNIKRLYVLFSVAVCLQYMLCIVYADSYS